MAICYSRQSASPPVHTTSLRGLKKIHTGKVRDIYAIDADSMLIVTTDRLSAFDVVMPDPIPGQGPRAQFHLEFLVRAHRAHRPQPSHRPRCRRGGAAIRPSARCSPIARVIVKRLKTVPLEAVVRGYRHRLGLEGLPEDRLDLRHQTARRACSRPRKLPQTLVHALDQGRRSASTTRTSASSRPRRLVGADIAARVRDTAIALYEFAAKYARERGIIIADTKFEFGLDADGELMLIDEVLTPDSSRFWPADTYREGTSPPSFDKQFVRDYLETLDWNKKAPGPKLPAGNHREDAAPSISKRLKRLTAVTAVPG